MKEKADNLQLFINGKKRKMNSLHTNFHRLANRSQIRQYRLCHSFAGELGRKVEGAKKVIII